MTCNLKTNGTMIDEREPELHEFTPEECEREYWRVLGYDPKMEIESDACE